MGKPYVTFPVASTMMTVRLRVILTMPPEESVVSLPALRFYPRLVILTFIKHLIEQLETIYKSSVRQCG